MYEDLKIILYPDPRLLKMSKPVEKFDPSLKELAARMFVLMRKIAESAWRRRRWG